MKAVKLASCITLITFGWADSIRAEGLRQMFSSLGMVEEVIATSQHPHAYDRRSALLEVEIGYGYVNESNNFENEAYQVGLGVPIGGGSHFRLLLRRVNVYSTTSSHLVGRTPFKQAAGQTRYELATGVMWSIIEGRSISRLSPSISDLEHVFNLVGNLKYSHRNSSIVPKRNDVPAPYAGQDPVHSQIGLELGLRWHLYLPQAFGIYFESLLNIPFSDTKDLKRWTYFSGGVLWSVQ